MLRSEASSESAPDEPSLRCEVFVAPPIDGCLPGFTLEILRTSLLAGFVRPHCVFSSRHFGQHWSALAEAVSRDARSSAIEPVSSSTSRRPVIRGLQLANRELALNTDLNTSSSATLSPGTDCKLVFRAPHESLLELWRCDRA